MRIERVFRGRYRKGRDLSSIGDPTIIASSRLMSSRSGAPGLHPPTRCVPLSATTTSLVPRRSDVPASRSFVDEPRLLTQIGNVLDRPSATRLPRGRDGRLLGVYSPTSGLTRAVLDDHHQTSPTPARELRVTDGRPAGPWVVSRPHRRSLGVDPEPGVWTTDCHCCALRGSGGMPVVASTTTPARVRRSRADGGRNRRCKYPEAPHLFRRDRHVVTCSSAEVGTEAEPLPPRSRATCRSDHGIRFPAPYPHLDPSQHQT